MKNTSLVITIAFIITILSLIAYSHKSVDETPAMQIYNAMESILNDNNNGNHDIFTDEQFKKIIKFREKLRQENLDTYIIETFQPDDENIVYFMLISKPTPHKEQGLVLYITFNLDDIKELKIKDIIISNWVDIEYNAIQF